MHANSMSTHVNSLSDAAEVQDALLALKDYRLTIPHPGGAWAMTEDACRFVGALLRRLKPQRVLEFGSGVSTTVIATELKQVPGAKLISIDHHRAALAKARELAEQHDVADVVEFYRCPIRPGRYHGKVLFFYDMPHRLRSQLQDLDVVLVDGPPGTWGREAAAYAVFPYLKPGAFVLLDDANRPAEQEHISDWHKIYGPAIEIVSAGPFTRGLGVLRKREDSSGTRTFSSRERRLALLSVLQRVAEHPRRVRDLF